MLHDLAHLSFAPAGTDAESAERSRHVLVAAELVSALRPQLHQLERPVAAQPLRLQHLQDIAFLQLALEALVQQPLDFLGLFIHGEHRLYLAGFIFKFNFVV